MKKILPLFVLMLTFGSATTITASERLSDNGDGAAQIRISNEPTPIPETKPKPKSVILETVECWLNTDEGTIDFLFNSSIGIATVSVIDSSGATVSQTTVNTDFNSMLTIAAPSQSGFYSISVISSTFNGWGNFAL